MKFQKLDSKQMPQVVALGALSLGVFGWAGYSVLGSGTPAPPPQQPQGQPSEAQQQPQQNDGTRLAQATAGAEAAPAGVGDPASPALATGLSLPTQYNVDPFRPARHFDAKLPKPTVMVKPAAKPSRESRPLREYQAQPLPFPGLRARVEQPRQGSAPRFQPSKPPSPVRPTVMLTGVIDMEEGQDMALVQLDGEQRIVQLGDLVANNYRVKEIRMDGLVLVNGKDRFLVFLGANTEAKANG